MSYKYSTVYFSLIADDRDNSSELTVTYTLENAGNSCQ